MAGFSDFWENKILNYLFSKDTYSPPTIHIGLSTSDPGDDGSGLSEPSGNGYTRIQTSSNDWNASAGGVISNSQNITFSQATGNWGTITHFALFDAASGGNILAGGALSTAKTIGDGDTATFTGGSPGDLQVSLD